MSEKEKLMYSILGKISDTDVPVVFKGALITKLVLAENKFTSVNRETKDIDMNWVGQRQPTMEELKKVVDEALDKLGQGFSSEISRKPIIGEQTAGVTIFNKNNKKVVTMDIDIKDVTGSRDYIFEADKIRGVLPTEIFADKVAAMSGNRIFRRAKDLIDVYALSSCVNINTAEIFETSTKTGNEIKAFDGFLNRKAEIQHAYEKLRYVDGKPPFEVVYQQLQTFLTPFIEQDRTPRIWNSDSKSWENVPEKFLENNTPNIQTPEKVSSPISMSNFANIDIEIDDDEFEQSDERDYNDPEHNTDEYEIE